MFSHLLIATDGSELSDRALAQGFLLAKALAATVTVVTATDMIPTGAYGPIPWPTDIERYEAAAAKAAERILGRAREMASTQNLSCEFLHIVDGRPFEAFIKTARERACDLIVMASHGRAGISSVFLGSETQKVLIRATVPVLVIR